MVQTFKKKKGSKLLVYVSVLFYLSELTKLPVSSTQNWLFLGTINVSNL